MDCWPTQKRKNDKWVIDCRFNRRNIEIFEWSNDSRSKYGNFTLTLTHSIDFCCLLGRKSQLAATRAERKRGKLSSRGYSLISLLSGFHYFLRSCHYIYGLFCSLYVQGIFSRLNLYTQNCWIDILRNVRRLIYSAGVSRLSLIMVHSNFCKHEYSKSGQRSYCSL